jgi:DNA mismatch repair ATPase MutS
MQPESIRDMNENRPEDPNYDPGTLLVPTHILARETPLFKSYWKAKKSHFMKIVFIRISRNFLCFYNDAYILNKLFSKQVKCWGTRPCVYVYAYQYLLYVKNLIEGG